MKKYLLLVGGILVLGACKKNDDATPTAQSKTDLLTAHNWKPSTGTYTITSSGTSITSDAFETCDKDDSYKFGSDKSLVVDAGTVKCNSSDPQKETGTWALSNNDQKLTMNLPNQAINGDLDVKELTTTTLHLSGTQTSNGVTFTVDATFVPY